MSSDPCVWKRAKKEERLNGGEANEVSEEGRRGFVVQLRWDSSSVRLIDISLESEAEALQNATPLLESPMLHSCQISSQFKLFQTC